jgi:hypothetical protein
MEKYIDRVEIQDIAEEHYLGNVYFEYRTAANTGKQFEAGYVMQDNRKVLFCKSSIFAPEGHFYLCNDFRKINGTD